jgi:hypothetical protein
MRVKLFFVKILNWEYWPFHVVYFPIFFYWLWLSLKARSLFYFSAANPSIETGGMLGESKFQILKRIPEKFIPSTIFIEAGLEFNTLKEKINRASMVYPLIAKPDVGERGNMVKKINNEIELNDYWKRIKVNFLIQEFINFEIELGVFYYRHPDWKDGLVSSVVVKDYLKVIGDGRSTIFDLMARYPRAAFQLERLSAQNRELMDFVPKENESIELEPIGNHSRGTTFLNGNYLIEEKLTAVFDRISKTIDGFYYGRYDLKCKSIEDLRQGEHIKIVELNGVGAEPAHIYHPGYSIIKGYKALFSHWKHMYEISRKNKEAGHPYLTLKEGWEKWKWIRQYNRMHR